MNSQIVDFLFFARLSLKLISGEIKFCSGVLVFGSTALPHEKVTETLFFRNLLQYSGFLFSFSYFVSLCLLYRKWICHEHFQHFQTI